MNEFLEYPESFELTLGAIIDGLAKLRLAAVGLIVRRDSLFRQDGTEQSCFSTDGLSTEQRDRGMHVVVEKFRTAAMDDVLFLDVNREFTHYTLRGLPKGVATVYGYAVGFHVFNQSDITQALYADMIALQLGYSIQMYHQNALSRVSGIHLN